MGIFNLLKSKQFTTCKTSVNSMQANGTTEI